MSEHLTEPVGNGRQNPLTSIHLRIHCGTTQETEDVSSEQDRIEIEAFLHALAEMALAVASRRDRVTEEGKITP